VAPPWDDAEAGLKPRDRPKWHQRTTEIDCLLTGALGQFPPFRLACNLKTLLTSLNKFDGSDQRVHPGTVRFGGAGGGDSGCGAIPYAAGAVPGISSQYRRRVGQGDPAVHGGWHRTSAGWRTRLPAAPAVPRKRALPAGEVQTTAPATAPAASVPVGARVRYAIPGATGEQEDGPAAAAAYPRGRRGRCRSKRLRPGDPTVGCAGSVNKPERPPGRDSGVFAMVKCRYCCVPSCRPGKAIQPRGGHYD